MPPKGGRETHGSLPPFAIPHPSLPRPTRFRRKRYPAIGKMRRYVRIVCSGRMLATRPLLRAAILRVRPAAAPLSSIHTWELFAQLGEIVFVNPFLAVTAVRAHIARHNDRRKQCRTGMNPLIAQYFGAIINFQNDTASAFGALFVFFIMLLLVGHAKGCTGRYRSRIAAKRSMKKSKDHMGFVSWCMPNTGPKQLGVFPLLHRCVIPARFLLVLGQSHRIPG